MRLPWSRWIALAAPIGLLACGGSSPRQTQADGAAGNPSGDGAAADTVVVAAVASNGAPIPPADPDDSCGGLDIKVASCVQGSSCPRVACDCPATNDPSDPQNLKFDFDSGFGCVPVGCISSISCSVACRVRQEQGNDEVRVTVGLCFANGLCTNDQDCGADHVCLRLPGQSSGECSNRGPGADCLADSDCMTPPCVVMSPTRRTCGSGPEGAACNLDSHCQSGRCLFASPDKFVGVCSDGTNDDVCFHEGDCKAGLRCLETLGRCSTGAAGAACKLPEDCNSGICVNDQFERGTCSDGAVGARCQSSDQCLSGFCPGFLAQCTTGAIDAPCSRDDDCANGHCGELGCTDGALGHSCRTTAQCAAGLHCSAVSGGVCVSPAANGTSCMADVDCQSGHCGPVAGSPLLECTN